MQKLGRKVLASDPSFFFKKDLLVIAYVDDILVAGKQEQVDDFFTNMGAAMKLKQRQDINEEMLVKYVGRYAVWLPRDYYDDIVSEIGLEGSRAVNTPVTTETNRAA